MDEYIEKTEGQKQTTQQSQSSDVKTYTADEVRELLSREKNEWKKGVSENISAVHDEMKKELDELKAHAQEEKRSLLRGSITETLKAKGVSDNIISLVMKAEGISGPGPGPAISIDAEGNTMLGEGENAKSIENFCTEIAQQYGRTAVQHNRNFQGFARPEKVSHESESEKFFKELVENPAPTSVKEIFQNGRKIFMENN